jgi:hypothetical protein
MKTILTILLLLSAVPLAAQDLVTGGFISIGGGVAAHDNGPFSRRLSSYTPLSDGGEAQKLVYRTGTFSQVGLTLWAGGSFVVGGRWMIGASGEMVSFPSVHSINGPEQPQDEYQLSGKGGGLELGMTVINDGGMVVFPYLHVGYYGYSLDYTNNQTDSISFFEGELVPPEQTATYTGAAPRIALGIGFTKLLGSGSGGFILGARLAYGRMLARPEWERDGTVVNNGGHTPEYNAVLLTLSLGGGAGWL